MKLKHLLPTLALVPTLAFATDSDSWTSHDKALHFGVSAALGMAAGSQWPDHKGRAFALALTPGVLKELSDARKGGSGFSIKDLTADALGAALGVYAAGWLISYSQGATTVTYTTKF